MLANGEIERSRAAQAKAWMWNETAEILLESLRTHPKLSIRVQELEAQVAQGALSPWVAAQELVETFVNKEKPGIQ